MLTPDHPEPDLQLSAADAAVLDTVMRSRGGGDATGPMPPDAGDRRAVMERLMGLLAADAEHLELGSGDALVRATVDRVAAARAAGGEPVEIKTLCAADAAVLDAVLPGKGQPGPTPSGQSERADRVRGVLTLLNHLSEPADAADLEADADRLVQRTLDAAAEQRQRERFAQQIELFSEPRRTLGVSLRQVIAAAAVFLLGFSLLMPAIERNRAEAQQIACATNLGIAGRQMQAYAVDHAGMLPRGPVGSSWIKTGQPDAIDDAGRYQSNSAHLYLLIHAGYTAPERLACPANDQANVGGVGGVRQFDWGTPRAVSYSYQNQHGTTPIRLDRSSPTLAVLADKNPLFVVRSGQVVFDVDADRDARSSLHRARGQNILTLDGRVRWTATPRIGDDNVWQIAGHAGAYDGTEAPADAGRDSFLVP